MKHTHWLDETGRGAEGGPQWEIAQVLIDPEDHNDWEARFTVPLEKSRAENRAVVQFDSVAMIGGDFPAGSLTQPSAERHRLSPHRSSSKETAPGGIGFPFAHRLEGRP